MTILKTSFDQILFPFEFEQIFSICARHFKLETLFFSPLWVANNNAIQYTRKTTFIYLFLQFLFISYHELYEYLFSIRWQFRISRELSFPKKILLNTFNCFPIVVCIYLAHLSNNIFYSYPQPTGKTCYFIVFRNDIYCLHSERKNVRKEVKLCAKQIKVIQPTIQHRMRVYNYRSNIFFCDFCFVLLLNEIQLFLIKNQKIKRRFFSPIFKLFVYVTQKTCFLLSSKINYNFWFRVRGLDVFCRLSSLFIYPLMQIKKKKK